MYEFPIVDESPSINPSVFLVVWVLFGFDPQPTFVFLESGTSRDKHGIWI